MYVIIISTFAIAVLVLLIVRQKRLHRIEARFQFVPDCPVDKSCLMMTIMPCGSIIDKALDCLSTYDDIAVCRNNRLGAEELDILGNKVRACFSSTNSHGGRTMVYHEHMLEATAKISEIARHIITTPYSCIPVSYKCEIETIRGSLSRLLRSTDTLIQTDNITDSIRTEINKDKDFIEHTIAIHSKGMTHEDFDDEAPAYTYLMLFYYLHSFVSSLYRIIKTIEVPNKTLIA